jgi:hypothetical protein
VEVQALASATTGNANKNFLSMLDPPQELGTQRYRRGDSPSKAYAVTIYKASPLDSLWRDAFPFSYTPRLRIFVPALFNADSEPCHEPPQRRSAASPRRATPRALARRPTPTSLSPGRAIRRPRRSAARRPPHPHDAFTARRKHDFLRALVKSGTIEDAARAVGVNPRTVYRHQQGDPLFFDHCRIALRMAATPLEITAWQRAVEGVEQEFACGGQIHVPPPLRCRPASPSPPGLEPEEIRAAARLQAQAPAAPREEADRAGGACRNFVQGAEA